MEKLLEGLPLFRFREQGRRFIDSPRPLLQLLAGERAILFPASPVIRSRHTLRFQRNLDASAIRSVDRLVEDHVPVVIAPVDGFTHGEN